MNFNPIDEAVKYLANARLADIEKCFDSDFISFFGTITNGVASHLKKIMEDIHGEKQHKKLLFMLTTTGGSATEAERIVNVLRNFYDDVSFVVPNFAYSAGTILCMSGDNIYMDYFGVLGPIDPQIQRQDGTLIAAQGYLDKVNEFIEKSKQGILSNAELVMLSKIDLADLRMYEQARELTIDLLKRWLVKYKFRAWTQHRTDELKKGKEVTNSEKLLRAEEIAKKLSDSNIWKTHARGLDINILHDELRLDIINYGLNEKQSELFNCYFELISDYIRKNNLLFFIHTRRYF